MRILMSLA